MASHDHDHDHDRDHDYGRAAALSVQLARAHQDLRRSVHQIRSGLGRPGSDARTLAVHCLAFCAALTAHHQGEDAGMFAGLLRERPDLADTVTKLVEDHKMIARLLSRVSELAGKAEALPGPAVQSIGRELDGLMAIMESHFQFEERSIGAALEAGTASPGWAEQVFRFAGDPS